MLDPAMSVEYASERLACAVIDDVHIAVHGKKDPDDADWAAYIAAGRKVLEHHDEPRVLVLTYGGNPSGAQRAKLNELNAGLSPLVAVMVDSRIARGAVIALSWFNPRIKAFPLNDLDAALTHLQLDASATQRVKDAIEELEYARRSANN